MSLFHWTDAAKSDLRSIDREQALKILHHLTDYGSTGHGDVKQLKGATDFRLRIGDYRVRFERLEDGVLRILQVKHRKKPIAEGIYNDKRMVASKESRDLPSLDAFVAENSRQGINSSLPTLQPASTFLSSTSHWGSRYWYDGLSAAKLVHAIARRGVVLVRGTQFGFGWGE